MVETFMNLNNLAVDLKSKQSISKQAGLPEHLSKIPKVSAQKFVTVFNFVFECRLILIGSVWF